MLGYGGGNAADKYLIQRIQGASPEQLASMMLEGAQKFLMQAIQAMKNRDIPGKARLVNRVSAIIEELTVWLDLENGGDTATNLARVYDWWLFELFDASQANQPDRLDRLVSQMGDIRSAWDQLHTQKATSAPRPEGLATEHLLG